MINDDSSGRVPQLRALARNLRAGLYGVFFRRLPVREGDANWSQLMLLVLLGLVVQLAWDFSVAGLNGEFSTFGLPGALFGLPVLLFAAWLAALIRRQPEKTLLLAIAFCAIGIPFSILAPLLHRLPEGLVRRFEMRWGYEDNPFMVVWYALSCGVAARRFLAIPKGWGWVSAPFFVAAVIAVPLTLIYRDHSLWTVPYDRDEAREEFSRLNALDREDVFYLQPRLLQQQLDAVIPQRHEGINLFFVGVAGYADQDVFLKEVKYVDKLFQDRFGTAGHSILLANNPGTAKELPIASATSIGLALKKVGDTMDKESDILFLYLTSHGSRDHKFSLDFGQMKFDALDPPRLRKLLDDSGIKHRVVVVGACYSGGFVDALKSDDTLVITSAASDRTSFGCSDEEDFTYFGRAYFADALSGTDSFIDAFTLAKPIIAAREQANDYTPSDPRIDVGAAIKAPLEAFSRQQREARVAQNLARYKLRPDIAVAPVVARSDAAAPSSPHGHETSEHETSEHDRLEAARRIVTLTRYETQLQDSIEDCEEYVAKKDSPEKEFDKNPNAFMGLGPKSSNWPKLIEAYRHYWLQNCTLFQADVYIDVMARSYASGMTEQELADTSRFLSTHSGQAFVISALSAAKSFQKENDDQIKVRHQRLVDEYNKTLTDLVATDPKAGRAAASDASPWWHFW